MANAPTVTALYGSLNAVFNIFLAWRVSELRRTEKVGIGLGESKPLLVGSRIHANNAEFMPLFVIMLLLAELCGGSSLWLHVAGGSLLTARIAHAVGMPMKAPNPFRFMGTAVTWTGIVVLAGWILVLRMK